MPELPEVETVRRGLAALLVGRTLVRIQVRRRDLRRPLPRGFAKRLVGRRIAAVRRRAKYLQLVCEDGTVLLVHLGMSGRLHFLRWPPPPRRPHDHVNFSFDDGGTVRYNDARRFGLMDLTDLTGLALHPLLRELGPEPLASDFTPAVLAAALAGKATPIKAALLDQRVVAGLGNIYVCESLFRAGLSPLRLARTVAGARADRLVREIRAVLEEAIAAGGSTLRDFVQASGELGYFQAQFRVYGRESEPCRGCGKAIRRIVQSGRSTFYCPRCQK